MKDKTVLSHSFSGDVSMLSVSTPGRICLFGEHQDYLGLPVIAAAISRRIQIRGHLRNDNLVVIHMPDINEKETFQLENPLIYKKKRDYFRSVINILRQREGIRINQGIEVTVRGNIPINSGTSSSSALLVTWTHFLLNLFGKDTPKTAQQIAEITYQAEVLEFGEPGGMMDQYSTAVGNIIYLESQPAMRVENYNVSLGTFVLGDSLEPKDTLNVLKHVKFKMLDALVKIKNVDPHFNLHHTPYSQAEQYKSLLSADEFTLLKSNLSDRDILLEAKKLFETNQVDDKQLGNLLTRHQANLRDAKRVSTPKINAMIDAALKAGALGAKINGSGGGGCMFAYAPEQPEVVAEAIEKQGGKAYIITIDSGTRIETSPNPLFA